MASTIIGLWGLRLHSKSLSKCLKIYILAGLFWKSNGYDYRYYGSGYETGGYSELKGMADVL